MCEILFINIVIIIIHIASDWQEAERITPINFSSILLISSFICCASTRNAWKLETPFAASPSNKLEDKLLYVS